MYGLTEGKPIRRADLNSHSTSPEPSLPDTTIEARLREQLNLEYALPDKILDRTTPVQQQLDTQTVPNDGGEDADIFEFRLFSKSTSKPLHTNERAGVPLRVNIRSPSPCVGEPGFLRPRRSDTYYFKGDPSVEEKEQYRSAAVSGDEITRQISVRWHGCSLPWRVITINATARTETSNSSAHTKSNPVRRTRQGKKRRIITRKKMALIAAKQAQVNMTQADREAAEREKRTRRNREKKVKKKEKEKAKKTQNIDQQS
ncbi:hypothetical protein MMC24_001269 [Lignoscripta atroalba]|nr:hypothetical protein [Lignoscripta atroalba]